VVGAAAKKYPEVAKAIAASADVEIAGHGMVWDDRNIKNGITIRNSNL